MALYPAAVQKPWTPYSPERYITPRIVIVHTNAVNAEDPGSTGGLSWHFQIGQHGTVYQHRDTSTRAAANANANGFAISIETWDGGDPEGNPWNDQQLDALVALIGWCCDTHKIPRRTTTTWDGTGLGYHRLFPPWNIPYHSCPGNTRVAQYDSVLLPRLQAPIPIPITEEEVNDLLMCQLSDGTGIVLANLRTGKQHDMGDASGNDNVGAYAGAGVKIVKISTAEMGKLLADCQ